MMLAILLLVAFYLLLVAEFLLPTGGLLGLGAAAAIISSVVIAFSHSITFGCVLVTGSIVTTPMLVMILVRIWPHTPIGRRVLNRQPGQVNQAGPPRVTRTGMPLIELVGMRGVAGTNLYPGGQVIIAGQRLDAISTGMPIEAGTAVVVTSVHGGRIHVRHVAPDDQPVPGSMNSAQRPLVSPPSLEQSLDDL